MKPKFSAIPLLALAAAVAAFLFPVAGHSALTWNAERIELTTKPNDKEAVGLFRFVNSGSKTVTITSVQPSCGCTTAQLDKRTYAPGESGEIKAVFTLGGRVGEQEKIIYVMTDDPSARPVSLLLHVVIPELLACTPRLLIWRVGGEAGPKSATLSANTKLPIKSVELVQTSLPKEVTARVESVDSGTKFKLWVAPVSLAQVMNVTVAGTATFSDGTIQPFNVYALVR